MHQECVIFCKVHNHSQHQRVYLDDHQYSVILLYSHIF